jgi:hypothetical protein
MAGHIAKPAAIIAADAAAIPHHKRRALRERSPVGVSIAVPVNKQSHTQKCNG